MAQKSGFFKKPGFSVPKGKGKGLEVEGARGRGGKTLYRLNGLG